MSLLETSELLTQTHTILMKFELVHRISLGRLMKLKSRTNFVIY